MDTIDLLMQLGPRPRPALDAFKKAKIIAHRGFTLSGSKENTLEAFRQAQSMGVWGIEFDIRWTKDTVPVIHHDASLERVFGDPSAISTLTSAELRARFPEIPTLEELLKEFAHRIHLMIEIKDVVFDNPTRIESLKEHLVGLEPIRDYHLMCLRVSDLLACQFVPRATCLPIAEFNVQKLSEASLEHGFGGLTAQYIMASDEIINRHHAVGQKIGTGFISSQSVLYRELNRKIDWLFTNSAAEVMKMLKN